MLEAYTDGSSYRNGKPDCTAGWSFVVKRPSDGFLFVRYGHLSAPSSNNRGEIMGVLYGVLKYNFPIHFHSDSQYVVNSINQWRHKHAKTNYEGIKNPDLLVPLYNTWDQKGKFKISWVRGHQGLEGNELADEYCGYGGKQIDRTFEGKFANIKYVLEDEIMELLNEYNEKESS